MPRTDVYHEVVKQALVDRENRAMDRVEQDRQIVKLVAAGIPPARIVLGFHHPSQRPHTAFAVA